MSAYTPGPWHLGGNGFIVYAANGYAICDVKTFHGRNDGDAANARLIESDPRGSSLLADEMEREEEFQRDLAELNEEAA